MRTVVNGHFLNVCSICTLGAVSALRRRCGKIMPTLLSTRAWTDAARHVGSISELNPLTSHNAVFWAQGSSF